MKSPLLKPCSHNNHKGYVDLYQSFRKEIRHNAEVVFVYMSKVMYDFSKCLTDTVTDVEATTIMTMIIPIGVHYSPFTRRLIQKDWNV